MNVDLGIWSKLTRLFIVMLMLTAMLGVLLWYLPLIRYNEALRKKHLNLETKIKFEEAKEVELRLAIKALQDDPRTLERLAREKLGYAKTNETVVRFEPPPTTQASR
jgi:cell division protein FtsB